MLGQLTPATPARGEQPQDVAAPSGGLPLDLLATGRRARIATARRRRSCRTRSGNALSNASIGVLRVFIIAVWIPDPPVLVPATGAS